MENVSESLRADIRSARIWVTHDQIVTARADAWNWLADPDRIRPVGTRDRAAVDLEGRRYLSRVQIMYGIA